MNLFLHGSDKALPKFSDLKPNPNYSEKWNDLTSYSPLEKHRPSGYKSQKDSVFMVKKEEDLDCCGCGEEFVFIVLAEGKVTKHDMSWATEISNLLGDGVSEDDVRIAKCAEAYWSGRSAETIGMEPVWEYMTDSAKIIRVYDYATDIDLDKVILSIQGHSKNNENEYHP
jgi:hypothetical protein